MAEAHVLYSGGSCTVRRSGRLDFVLRRLMAAGISSLEESLDPMKRNDADFQE